MSERAEGVPIRQGQERGRQEHEAAGKQQCTLTYLSALMLFIRS
jgi:hypothetical protein